MVTRKPFDAWHLVQSQRLVHSMNNGLEDAASLGLKHVIMRNRGNADKSARFMLLQQISTQRNVKRGDKCADEN
jgi:hypothetical protein